ncbi:MAG: M23 family metallopeptidase [Kiloniellales bacterium]|nr:M23 family metallopeptidase [Kiloniellales bacterium]
MFSQSALPRLLSLLPALGLIALAPAAGAADTLRLGLPVDCDLGGLCVVQHYVDMDPGPDGRDHRCGPLTYDDHNGIDIRVPTYVEMERGVPVVAAAAGVVKELRDGMADISIKEAGEDSIEGRKAGNSVIIDHGEGWETQYAHLRRESIVVQRGAEVEAGDQLGLIGLSGATEFPHLHFSVRRNGMRIDPFTGLAAGSGCGRSLRSLWHEEARRKLIYRPGGLLVAGFADQPTESTVALMKGAHRETVLPSTAPSLIFWTLAWGLRGGDREMRRLFGPDGRVLIESTYLVPKDKAQWQRHIGRRLRGDAWPKGVYKGTYRVERDEGGITTTVIDVERALTVE